MRIRLHLAAALIALAAFSAFALAGPSARTAMGPGERQFLATCASCHGPRGEGGRGPTLAVPRLTRARDRATLVTLIERGVPGTEMPSHKLSKTDLQQIAGFVERLGRLPVEKFPGDPQKGMALYRGKGGCTICHAIHGRGGALGTDLTDVGLRRGAGYLRKALVEPEADLPRSTSPYRSDVTLTQNFLQVRVTTTDGREITGVRINEDTFSIQIRDAGNQMHSLWKSELAQLHKDWDRSPMPSYKEALTATELDDLVAFLLSLRGERPPGASDSTAAAATSIASPGTANTHQ